MGAIAVLFPESLTPESVVRLLPKLLVLVVIVGLILLFVWILWGALLHVLSRLAGGSGAFSNTLAVAAYGWGPPIAVGVISIVLGVGYSLTPLAPGVSTIEAYGAFLDRTETSVELYSNLLTAIWQWYVWTFGLKRGRDLSTSRAALVAGVVALTTVLWSVL